MKNRLVRSMLMVGAMVMALATPVYAMEEKDVVYSEKTAQTRSALSPTTGTTKDSYGNKYSVYGYSDCSGTLAIAETGFSIYHYDDTTGYTQSQINNFKKHLSVECIIQTNNYGNINTYPCRISSVTKTGKNYSYQKTYSYNYNVSYVKTKHTFSCEGASWETTTYN